MPAFPKNISLLCAYFVLILMVLSGCKHLPKAVVVSVKDSVKIIRYDTVYNNIFNKDSVVSYFDGDTMVLHKNELELIQKYHPELIGDFPQHPDISYQIAESRHIEQDTIFSYGCEVCQDDYYVKYAYFLKIRNGEKIYAGMRDTLINMYLLINCINRDLTGGGTYFAHQLSRIYAYAEYAIYNQNKMEDWYAKDYDIGKQKRLLISALKQHITDEVYSNYNVFSIKNRVKSQKELFGQADEIGKLLTNYFYLHQAQQFQYANY